MENFWLGLLIILCGGIMNSSFALPMKYSRVWKWENNWFLFTLLALFVLPAVVAYLAVPNLVQVYSAASFSDLLPGLVFGFLWGLAQATFGLSIAMVGMAMAFVIVLGMSALIGSFLPMLVLHPEALLGPRGIAMAVSAVLMLFGLAAYGKAARERETQSGAIVAAGGSFRKGLWLCLFTGLTGSMMNVGFALSGNLSALTVQFGASPRTANLAVWVVVLSAGWIPNVAYTVWRMARNRTFSLFGTETRREGLLATAMAVLWLGGVLIYGSGSTTMGKYGTSIGWAINVIILLLWSTTLGILTGEWKNVQPRTLRKMRIGVGIILASVLVLSATGLLPQ